MGEHAGGLAIGSRVGRFVILQQLGQGTSGTVYLAEDTVLEAKVALKTLDPSAREIGTARFKREILLARSIAHPGVCRVFDLHEEEGRLFLTMEYVPGETLEVILSRQGRLGISRSVRIVRDIVLAVGAAHAAGIIHRDLKPANIVLALGRRPTVLDFGCALLPTQDRVTRIGQLVGTARYLAPELLSFRADSSVAADLYAVGVILFRCLTGRFQFQANTLEQLRTQAGSSPSPPSRFVPEISAGLDAVVSRCLAREPGARYQSAAELEQALSRVLEDTAPHIKMPVPEPASPWDRDIERTVTAVVRTIREEDLASDRETLTTVLFSDIAGITEFFATHGSAAGRRRIATHNELAFAQIRSWSGTLVKTAGDAVMASFAAADDGVNAAIAMQRAVSGFNRDGQKEPLALRIGVNSGAATLDGSELFGEAVRLAARAASRAAPGQILITAATQAGLSGGEVSIRLHETLRPSAGRDENLELHRVVWEPPAERRDTAVTQPDHKLPDWALEPPPQRQTQTDQSDEPITEPNPVPVQAPPEPSAPEMSPSPALVEAWGLPAPENDSGGLGSERESKQVFSEQARRAQKALARARAKQGDHAEWPKRCALLTTQLEAALGKKGIIPGDDPALDRLIETSVRQLNQGRYEQATRILEFAVKHVHYLKVDGVFIANKLRRLERTIAKAGKDTALFAATLAEVNERRQHRAYDEANAALNRAFGLLRPGTSGG